MKPIQINYATPADNHLLAEIGAQTFYDSFAAENTPENIAAYLESAFSPDKQAAELADPASIFLIARVEQSVVGYAKLKEGPPPVLQAGIRPIELVRFYAVKAWIGRGIGSALMRASLHEVQRRGCDFLWLGVWERNQRARQFYHKWGFMEAGTQVFQMGAEAQTDFVLVKVLRPEGKDSVHEPG